MKSLPSLLKKFYHSIHYKGLLLTYKHTLRYLKTTFFLQKRAITSIKIHKYIINEQSLDLTIFSPTLFSHTHPVVLVLDHTLGGGTQLFRQKHIDNALQKGRNIVLWQYCPKTYLYFFSYVTSQKTTTYSTPSWSEALLFVHSLSPTQIIHNSLVKWPNLHEILTFLPTLKNNKNTLDIFLHDYYPICPSIHLLNKDSSFCGLLSSPNLCDRCHTINPLVNKNRIGLSINAWRTLWQFLFQSADNIQIPDKSVYDFYKYIFPDSIQKFTIIPHTPLTSWSPLPLPFNKKMPLVIAVIGSIAKNKGAPLIEELAFLLKKEVPTAKIIVFGNLEASKRLPKNLRALGAYNHIDLPHLLAQYNATIGLIPSLCPETFCYVAQEIKQLGLPLVTFDLGAQAEHARTYEKGLVIPPFNIKALLCGIQKLHNKYFTQKNT